MRELWGSKNKEGPRSSIQRCADIHAHSPNSVKLASTWFLNSPRFFVSKAGNLSLESPLNATQFMPRLSPWSFSSNDQSSTSQLYRTCTLLFYKAIMSLRLRISFANSSDERLPAKFMGR